MNVRLIFLCVAANCALTVITGTGIATQRHTPESTSSNIVSNYANAWIAGNMEKMYKSFSPATLSFPEFQKLHSHCISVNDRPRQLIATGKPYPVSTLSMWAVNYTLRFNTNGVPIDKYYRALIAETNGDYVLWGNAPYFSETDIFSIKAVVESFLTEWKKGNTDKFCLMFSGDHDSSDINREISLLCKEIVRTNCIVPITQYQFNEPIAYLSADKAFIYPEISITRANHERKATLRFVVSRMQGVASKWMIDGIELSAPMQIRDAISKAVNYYLQAWMEGDAQGMYEKFHGLKGKAENIFSLVTQTSKTPLYVQAIDPPVFSSLNTAIVNYSCMFKNIKKESTLKTRQARVKDINGKWLIIADYGVISSEDKRSAKFQVQGYVSNWIAKNPEGMYKYFNTNIVALSVLKRKIRDDVEKDLVPQKFIRFLDVWSDNQDTIDIGFEVTNKSDTINYQARLSRTSGSDWAILSVTKCPDRHTIEQLNTKTMAYIKAWISGDAHAMFKCFDELEMEEPEFINAVKSSLAQEKKPVRLVSMNRPFYSGNNFIKVPYTVELIGQRQMCTSIFKFSEEKHTWLFVGNSITK